MGEQLGPYTLLSLPYVNELYTFSELTTYLGLIMLHLSYAKCTMS